MSSLYARLRSKKPVQIKISPAETAGQQPKEDLTDDETHISHNLVMEQQHQLQQLQQPWLNDLAKRKTLVQVASHKRENSLFCPKQQESMQFDIVVEDRHKSCSRSPFASRESRYRSLHDYTQVDAKGYIECIQSTRRTRRDRNNNNRSFVLQDQHQEPVALCLPDGRDLHYCKHAYVIYSRRPLCKDYDDEFDLEAVQHQGESFYPWMRLAVVHGLLTIQVWNGRDFAESLAAPQAQVNNKRHASCCFRLEGSTATRTKHSRGGWQVDCQAGADPAVMVCLTVVLGELIK